MCEYILQEKGHRLTIFRIIFVSCLTLTSSSICYYFHGQNCESLGPSLGGVVATTLTLNVAFHGAEAVLYEPAPAARSAIQSYQDMVRNALEAEGYTFNSIENIGFTHSIQKRSQDEPDLIQRFWIKGVQLQENGTSHDLLTHYYSNGDISVHHHPGAFANFTTFDLEKRDGSDHAGFKVSASVKRKGSYTLGEPNEVGQIVGGMLRGLGVVSARGKDNPFGNVYGYIEQPRGTDIVYFRIIPENKGYGLNYESVNECGALL